MKYYEVADKLKGENYTYHSTDDLKVKNIIKEADGKKFLIMYKEHTDVYGSYYKYYVTHIIR